jgi:hypothetical protein
VVARPPDGIDLERHRDAFASVARRAYRYVVLSAVLLLLGVALAGWVGQQPSRSIAEGPAVRLEVEAPSAVRGGLFFQGRFRIEARRAIQHATLVLDPAWQEQLSINTIEPSPVGEASREGRLALDFGAVQAGSVVVAYLQFQVNPAQWLVRRSQDVVLADGEVPLVRVDRTLTVYP